MRFVLPVVLVLAGLVAGLALPRAEASDAPAPVCHMPAALVGAKGIEALLVQHRALGLPNTSVSGVTSGVLICSW